MKVLLQSLKDGSIDLLEVPVPLVSEGHILVKTSVSMISSGTERMLLEFGKDNLINKALKQPDKVKQVVDKLKTDGILPTYQSVSSKLDEPIQLGYSNVGEVIEVGKGVTDFKVGDRVVSNGAHSEIVLVSKNLASKVPDNITDEEAVMTVLGSIGLQGIRLANPLFGETFLVSGLGLIGLITGQLLIANGCEVLGVDPDPDKCLLASSFGIKSQCLSEENDTLGWCLKNTKGKGVDGVIITAATKSSDPVHNAAKVSRKRGRIILVGVTGLELRRDLFYEKELSFQVSCSYGPGRYDEFYEKKGNDYPLAFVRWTVKRNFEAVLNSLEKKTLKVNSLISKTFNFTEAAEAYSYLLEKKSSLAILLKYKESAIQLKRSVRFSERKNRFSTNTKKDLVLNFLGSGNYASKILIPEFKKTGANLRCLAANGGVAPTWQGKKYGFEYSSTDVDKVISDKKANAIVISTRHDSHAKYVIESLNNGKHVFVEKPLCINKKELKKIEETLDNNRDLILMVGFNRRFSPYITQIKKQIEKSKTPKSIIYSCNSGFIADDHWINQYEVGGGRLIGEACHFIDLMRFLVGYEIESMELVNLRDKKSCPDTFSIQIKFNDGSIGCLQYFSNGHKSFPKERIELYDSGTIYQVNNFKSLKVYGASRLKNSKSLNQNKGQNLCTQAFINSILEEQEPPIPHEELIEVHNWILEVLEK